MRFWESSDWKCVYDALNICLTCSDNVKIKLADLRWDNLSNACWIIIIIKKTNKQKNKTCHYLALYLCWGICFCIKGYWIVLGITPTIPPWNLYLILLFPHYAGTGSSTQKTCENREVITEKRPRYPRVLSTLAGLRAKLKICPFLSSFFSFFLHVRALLGTAGPGYYWSLNPPSCKVLRCQTSSDLQLRAHAISLLLWVIKGKWEHSVQILPAILTCILSSRAAAWINPDHMAKGGKHGIMGNAGGMEGCRVMIPFLLYQNLIQKYQTVL